MLAAVLTAPNELAPTEVETPSPGPGEVLVAVGANTVCGTDVRIMRGEKTSGVRLPVVLGHETAGRVAAVGRGVSGYEVGAPVGVAPCLPCRRCWPCRHDMENVCERLRIAGYERDGGMAEYMLVSAEAVAAGCLFVAETDLPPEQLALAEPLACVVLGQRWARMDMGDAVLIMGAGPIGLLHLQLALISGARAVIVSQRGAARRAEAERLGATVAVDPTTGELPAVVEEITDGLGVDLSVICVGKAELVNEAISLSRPGGRVSVFAGLRDGGWAQVSANDVHYRQVVLTGTSNSRRADYETALRLIESGRIDTGGMITHRFGLADVHAAIDAVGRPDALKVAVVPSLEPRSETP